MAQTHSIRNSEISQAAGSSTSPAATNLSGTISVLLNGGTTAIKLVSGNPSPTYGQPVMFTATVSASNKGLPTPTGNVAFSADGVTLATIPLTSGVAQYSTSSLSAGTHVISATYLGSTHYFKRTATISQLVNKAISSIQAPTSSKNPAPVGDTVTFTAIVGSAVGIPTGSVTFFDGTTSLGSASVNASGSAMLPVSTLAFGPHTITASYNGDTNFLMSNSSGLSQSILHPSVTAVSSPGAITFGQQVTFTAMVTSSASGTPTGGVTFLADGNALGSGTLNGSAQATLTTSLNQPLAAGTRAITAVYGGDSSFFTSTSPVFNQTVNGFNFAVNISHPAKPNIIHIGEAVSFTASLANQSGSAVNNVVFNLGLGNGTGYFTSGSFTISPSGGSGSCDISAQPMECELGTMNAGDTATITATGVPTLAHTLFATASANATTNTKTDTVQVRFRPFRF